MRPSRGAWGRSGPPGNGSLADLLRTDRDQLRARRPRREEIGGGVVGSGRLVTVSTAAGGRTPPAAAARSASWRGTPSTVTCGRAGLRRSPSAPTSPTAPGRPTRTTAVGAGRASGLSPSRIGRGRAGPSREHLAPRVARPDRSRGGVLHIAGLRRGAGHLVAGVDGDLGDPVVPGPRMPVTCGAPWP